MVGLGGGANLIGADLLLTDADGLQHRLCSGQRIVPAFSAGNAGKIVLIVEDAETE